MTRLDETLDMLEISVKKAIANSEKDDSDQEMAAAVYCAHMCMTRPDLSPQQRERATKIYDKAEKVYKFMSIYKKF